MTKYLIDDIGLRKYCEAQCGLNSNEDRIEAREKWREDYELKTCYNIGNSDFWKCSKCRAVVLMSDGALPFLIGADCKPRKIKFCPNCGAKVAEDE